MEIAEKCLKDFFKTLRKIKCQWEALVDQAKRPLIALENQMEQLQLISCANLDDEFTTRFPDIKDRLSGKILVSIEEEMLSLRRIVENMNIYAEELKNKYLAVEQAYYKLNREVTQDFNPLRPPLSDLLEYAVDAFRLYYFSWLLRQHSLNNADYMDNRFIISIKKAFIEDSVKKEHIQHILSLTQLYEDS